VNVESIRDYCLNKTNATEGMPFGPTVLVFKVNNKMFCLMSLDEHPTTINVKCDPEIAIELREQHSSIIPGYHMNKKYWNTLIIDETLSSKLIKNCIDMSYDLVNKKSSTKR
jgi:predicted DNA-binding protein (MmcQ/YjbR family)